MEPSLPPVGGRGRARGRGRGQPQPVVATPATVQRAGPPVSQPIQSTQPGGRGRARGRGRGNPASTPQHPGSLASQPSQPSTNISVPPGFNEAAGSGDGALPPMAGRGVSRVKTTQQHRPGTAGDVAQTTKKMGAMAVGRRGAARHYKSNDTRFEMTGVPVANRHASSFDGDVKKKFIVNYFALEYKHGSEVYKYRVDFEPESDNSRTRAFVVRTALTNALGANVRFAFMETEIFITSALLDHYTVELANGDKMMVKFTSKKCIPWSSPEIFVVLNSVFRKSMGLLNLSKVQRHYYDMERKQTVTFGSSTLMVLPGFETAIGLYQDNKILLNVNLASRVLRSETVDSFLDSMYKNPKGLPKEKLLANIKDELVGQVVLTTYNKDKTYTIADIDFDLTPNDSFSKGEDKVSFVQYYAERYGQNLKNPSMRGMLVAKLTNRDKNRKIAQKTSSKPQDTGPVLLVPELCFMTGLTDSMRKNRNLMKAVAEITNKEPTFYANTLNNFMGDLLDKPESSENLKAWGLNFQRNLLTVDGRILHKVGGRVVNTVAGGRTIPFGVDDFSKDIRNCRVHDPKQITRWLCIFAPGMHDLATQFSKDLNKAVERMGIHINPRPELVETAGNSSSNYTDKIRQYTMNGLYHIIVTLLPRENTATYKAIKKLCYTELALASQVVTQRAASRGMAVATKVGIQMNCKLGGEMWRVSTPANHGVMVCGYDTYHSGPGSNKRSYGVLTSSKNPSFTKYYAQSFNNSPGEEMSVHLQQAITMSCRRYKESNQKYPTTVVIYRDGLGDGMLSAFAEIELEEMRKAVQKIDEKISLVVVIVKKRISTRIMLPSDRHPGQMMNPPPGSIIDGAITRPQWYDFYLISQTARQGCVSPTHYNVVWDDSTLPAHVIQSLTYRLTHLYYNWAGAISIPAPCQYAHKLAFLCGDVLSGSFSVSLSDTLFYL